MQRASRFGSGFPPPSANQEQLTMEQELQREELREPQPLAQAAPWLLSCILRQP